MLSRMTQESAYPCPVCRTLTTLEHPCPGCGRAPDPNAAAVITYDAQIIELRNRADTAKRSYDELAASLAELRGRTETARLAHETLASELAQLRRQRETYATAVRHAV